MSIKKQIPSLSKLDTIYEEVPERFLDENDVDSFFHLNILDIALIDNRIVRVTKGSNKKIFAFKLFQFCNLRNQQGLIFEEEVSVSLRKLVAILNTLRQLLKQCDKTVKFPTLYPLPKPKQEVVFALFKDELFAHYCQDIKEHCNRQIRLSFGFDRNKECCFSIKKFQIVGEKNVLTEIIAKCMDFTKIDTILPQKVEFLRAITMCSAFTPDCGFDNSTIILIEDVYCPKTKCLRKVCLHKRTFQSLGRSDNQ